jgi:hypothetical protein
MPANELIIRHKGKEYDFELTEHDADLISDLTGTIEYAPFDPEPVKWPHGNNPTKAEQAQREEQSKRFDDSRQAATDFQMPLKRLANLSEEQMRHVITLMDLMELGDLDGSQSNWALEFIESVFNDIVRYGSAAAALHQDPRGMLASLSHYMHNYWLWVRDSREVVKQHPEIFPTPSAEPEALPEPVATRTKPKTRRARKSGRKAA